MIFVDTPAASGISILWLASIVQYVTVGVLLQFENGHQQIQLTQRRSSAVVPKLEVSKDSHFYYSFSDS